MRLELKKIRHISLGFSVFFLLLHSFLPHTHQGEVSQGQPEKYVNAVEYSDAFAALLGALKSDQGEGHLENFQLSRDADVDFNSIHFSLLADLDAIALQITGLQVEDTTSCSLPGIQLHSTLQGHSWQIKGRAPPVLMV